jgi:hypothetical protein
MDIILRLNQERKSYMQILEIKTDEQAPVLNSGATPKQYHIEWVLGVTKASLKQKIWRMSNSQEAIDAIALIGSRRGGLFTLDELSSLADWFTWEDAAAAGEADATSGLSEWRDRQCRKKQERAYKKIAELKQLEERKS